MLEEAVTLLLQPKTTTSLSVYAPSAQETATEEPGNVALTPAQQAAERQLDPSNVYLKETPSPKCPFSRSRAIDSIAHCTGSKTSDNNSSNYKQVSGKKQQCALKSGEEAWYSNTINDRLLSRLAQVSVLNHNSIRN